MASITNVVIFTAKPIFSVLISQLRKSCCNRKSDNYSYNYNSCYNYIYNYNQDEQYNTRSTSVYKRPYFKWNRWIKPQVNTIVAHVNIHDHIQIQQCITGFVHKLMHASNHSKL